jgi:hypothetical protein
MANKRHSASTAAYHILVQGKLDEKWADWFDAFVVTMRDSDQTLLSGTVADQAELFGLLGKINSLGLPLLLVVRANCPYPEKKFAT